MKAHAIENDTASYLLVLSYWILTITLNQLKVWKYLHCGRDHEMVCKVLVRVRLDV